MKHKYVRFPTLGFVIWPMTDKVYHYDVARAFAKAERPISAGFVELYEGTVACYGKSESLGLHSMSGDSALLVKQLGLED